jgi:dinuclear metal center YbgI/SA1388 family protein
MTERTLSDVLAVIDRLWPATGAEEWDTPGLVVGSADQTVSVIHLMVDVTAESVSEALESGADMIIAHHPLLLRGVTSVAESTYKGHIVSSLIRSNCALYSAHTNADVVPTGTSETLARLLGIENSVPIVPGPNPSHGIGRVGTLETPMSLYEFAIRIGEILPQTAVGPLVAGNPERVVKNIAVCAGAGDSLLEEPAVLGSDVYVTSDLRHHPASEFLEKAARDNGPALINISHFAAEWLWLEVAAEELTRELGVSVVVNDVNTDPWSFQVQRVGGE